ncbi:hypothetical protein K450DRAFT_262280 [Umbelopsis ramanniana AG]|uniref:Retrotransposon gag domain-containing protein n=1 Tax=Umbelopsis ramanniana AG TaxID=1314678 RepID=A0AAD5E238_UMBRA|nr:uncharacterized protein K450DRAFT_262280 [Umbelopsis ramanniana AG]KAI8575337.1 hypothetical protein K450DRAFT_262280 [Umbelopsis ramanniana AG]
MMISLPLPRYSRKENPEYWLKMFQATAKVQVWTTDEDKLMFIPMFFKSEMRVWFYDGKYTDFQEFAAVFVERFGLKIKKYRPLKKTPTIRKKNKESAQAYGYRLRQWKVRHGASLSESDMLHQFVNGLNPKSLRQAVRAEYPKDLDTAIRKAIELEEDEHNPFSDSDEGPAYRDQESDDSSSDIDEQATKNRKNKIKTPNPWTKRLSPSRSKSKRCGFS